MKTPLLDISRDVEAFERRLHQDEQAAIVIRQLNRRPCLDTGLDPEGAAVVVRDLNGRTCLDARLDFQRRAVVITTVKASQPSGLHASRHLDARVLRRRLHGGFPFAFLRSELERDCARVTGCLMKVL